MIKNILCALLLASVTFISVSAQEENNTTETEQLAKMYRQSGNRLYYIKRELPINWMPTQRETQRYTIAIRPFYLINNGIKVDFEYELRTPGQWLQFEVVYRGTGWYNNGYYNNSYNDGWSNVESNNSSFSKLGGFGLGAAYKTMFTPNGWYFSAAVTFNYYNVHFLENYLEGFNEDGMLFYEYVTGYKSNKYYNPAFSLNIGKQVAITRNLFIDGYIGVGLTGSIHGTGNNPVKFGDSNMFSWGYSGLTFNGGFRIGWLFSAAKK